jgi:hypothetical protein
VGSDKGPAWLIPGGAFFWLFFVLRAGIGQQKIFAHDAARLIVRKTISAARCLLRGQTMIRQKTRKFAAVDAEP